MRGGEIIGAFGEADAARLTGLTIGQLRAWDRSAACCDQVLLQKTACCVTVGLIHSET